MDVIYYEESSFITIILMKRRIIRPNPNEDLAITKAAESDPDSLPFSDNEWERIKPTLVRGRGRPLGSRAVAPRNKLP